MSNLAALCHNRWALPVIAELERTRGGRFVLLQNRLAMPADSLRRTLTNLTNAGFVEPNPGHGHPLRPEYILTNKGLALAPSAKAVMSALTATKATGVGLKKWSLPTLLVLSHPPWNLRFNELRRELPEITARALTLTLTELIEADLVTRNSPQARPLQTHYHLTTRTQELAGALRTLEHRLT